MFGDVLLAVRIGHNAPDGVLFALNPVGGAGLAGGASGRVGQALLFDLGSCVGVNREGEFRDAARWCSDGNRATNASIDSTTTAATAGRQKCHSCEHHGGQGTFTFKHGILRLCGLALHQQTARTPAHPGQNKGASTSARNLRNNEPGSNQQARGWGRRDRMAELVIHFLQALQLMNDVTATEKRLDAPSLLRTCRASRRRLLICKCQRMQQCQGTGRKGRVLPLKLYSSKCRTRPTSSSKKELGNGRVRACDWLGAECG